MQTVIRSFINFLQILLFLNQFGKVESIGIATIESEIATQYEKKKISQGDIALKNQFLPGYD